MLFWHSKSYFDIRTKSENAILIFKILFWHSNWLGKSNSKLNFDIRTESKNRILTFKIIFRHSNWVGKCYFDIQNPILTFELSRKMLFWYLKSDFGIRTVSENSILTFKSYFDIRTESENAILAFKVIFWHSNWVWKSYFDIQNPILTFESSRKIVFKIVLTFKILVRFSN